MKDELPAVLVEHRGAENIARQQIGSELNTLEFQPHNPGQGVAQSSLAHARQVLDQQMPPRQQAGHCQLHL